MKQVDGHSDSADCGGAVVDTSLIIRMLVESYLSLKWEPNLFELYQPVNFQTLIYQPKSDQTS